MEIRRLTDDEFARRWAPLKPVRGFIYGEVPFSRLRAAERRGWKLVAVNLTAPRTPALVKRGGRGEG